jgi:hypothetical protein
MTGSTYKHGAAGYSENGVWLIAIYVCFDASIFNGLSIIILNVLYEEENKTNGVIRWMSLFGVKDANI